MPNYYLSVLYKHIIQVENKNVGLKVGGGGGTNIPLPPQLKKWGGHMPPLPPRFLRQCIYIHTHVRMRSLVRERALPLYYIHALLLLLNEIVTQ